MKPFNLEESKAGKPVCTKDGKKVRIICFDRKCEGPYKLIALIEISGCEENIVYTEEGKFCVGEESEFDLVMFPKKHEGWINIYHKGTTGTIIYKTEDEAKSSRGNNCVATIKIEWEE